MLAEPSGHQDRHTPERIGLSRIAQLDQRTALSDQCLHSVEADVRPPRRKSGFDLSHIAALMALQRGTDKAQKLLYSRAVSGWSST
jgi:hypothetical protein